MARWEYAPPGGVRAFVAYLVFTLAFVGLGAWLLWQAPRTWPILFVLIPIVVVGLREAIDAGRTLATGRAPRVVVDTEAAAVTLENMRIARSFWPPGRTAHVEIPRAEILGIAFFRRKGTRAIKLVTRQGTVEILGPGPGFEALWGWFSDLRRDGPGVPLTESYGFPLVVGLAATALIVLVLVAFGWL